jgi:hypothetical protein
MIRLINWFLNVQIRAIDVCFFLYIVAVVFFISWWK